MPASIIVHDDCARCSCCRNGSGMAPRSLEIIRRVFERHKGAICAIDSRALREDAALQGKGVPKLSIAPAGQVRDGRIEPSER